MNPTNPSKYPLPESQNLISPNIQKLKRMITEGGIKIPLNLSFKKKMANLISSKVFEYFIVSLIIFYTLIVFVNFGLSDSSNDNNEEIAETIYVLAICELVVLVIFTMEIIANIYVYNFKYYFRDKLLMFDAFVIIASIVLVATEFSITNNESFTLISRILRGVFRFFRIFLLFRKVNQFKKIKVAYSRYDVKSPVEKIIEILKNLQESLKKEEEDVKKIAWCIEVISSNRLYDPILENLFKENANQKEMLSWLANFSTDHQKKKSITLVTNKEIRKSVIVESDEWRKKRNGLLQASDFSKNESVILERIPINARNYLENVDDLEFNVFDYCEMVQGDGLAFLMTYLFEENDLFAKLDIEFQCFFNYMKKIQSGYLDENPYHNYMHAVDVTQTINFMIKTCKFAEMSNLTNLETAAMYFAACIHDYEHNGFNNAFHIATKTSLAIRYNDKAVLENHHVSAAFILSQKENYNIFGKFSKEDYSKLRERVITMVLCTDMSTHFNDLSKVKGRLATTDFDLKDKDKNLCMETLLHASDISNPIKPFDICFQWTDRVLQEFWRQGDEERKLKLPISYLMDRYTVNMAKSQIGFIDIIVLPIYEVIKAFLPNMQKYIGNLETNKSLWKEKIEEYEEKLKLIVEKKHEEDNNSKSLMAQP